MTLGDQMLTCVQKFHDLGFVHCDIKPDNFVMNGSNKVILIDFGLSHKMLTNDNYPEKVPFIEY